MIKSFDTIKDINVYFTMVYIIHKNRKFGKRRAIPIIISINRFVFTLA